MALMWCRCATLRNLHRYRRLHERQPPPIHFVAAIDLRRDVSSVAFSAQEPLAAFQYDATIDVEHGSRPMRFLGVLIPHQS